MPTPSMLLLRTLCLALFLCAALPGPADAAQPRRKVIIDQDTLGPGGSNMRSVLMLLQAPDVEVLGIVVCTGDGWRDESLASLLRMLELVQRTDVPVYAGAAFPLVNSAARTKAWEARFGPLVWKGAWTQAYTDGRPRSEYHADPFAIPPMAEGSPTLKVQPESGIAFMLRSVRQYPGQVTIWAGGPMTDLALAARQDPQFASLAKELVFMGGSFNPVPADNRFAEEYVHSPRREFNLFFDAEAATAVLHEAWPRITQLPVDPTTRTLFTPALQAEIGRAKTPVANYVATYGGEYPLWDELAAAVWLDPTLVTRRKTLLVDVATGDDAGLGGTLSWPLGRGPKLGEREVDVVLDVDVPRFERLMVQLLRQARSAP